MTDRGWRLTRAGLVFLAVSNLSVGVWATIATQAFYDDFPGAGRAWVRGDGPYNAHLVSDAGVGFLAVGAVLALAAMWMERRLVQAALVASLVHAVPHVLFHLRHPSDALDATDRWLSTGSLASGALLAAVLLVGVTSLRPTAPRTAGISSAGAA